jgi:DNA mismatch repair protein MutS2
VNGETLDLDAASADALELPAVLELVAAFGVLPSGRARLAAVTPSADIEALEAEHAAVREAGSHLDREGRLLPDRLPDHRPGLAALEVEGMNVDPLPLRDVGSVLLNGADLAARLAGKAGEGLPALRALGRGLPDLGPIVRPVVSNIAPDGRIEDGASVELKRIRQAIARTGERLRRQLESFLHDPAAQSVVRDDFVTQRNGRFVIPVRADAPRSVDGIVHASSSSGQTLFVEPMASVQLNNELVRLAEDEAAEQLRVVRGWADRLRARLPDVHAGLDAVERADTLQARALFARAIEGVFPELAGSGPLELEDVRHPLLDRRLSEQGARCVPISIVINPYDRALVVSGPNTGGKTVALKTIGLAVLMSQCGLPVAAGAAKLPVFRQLRADIGDHQSIDADLSTFSAHVRAVADCLAVASPPALFLFDEIGTGTEPGEGAALARAVLEAVLERGVTAVATTHLGALRAWAFSDPRVDSAAMEFDLATLRPSYHLVAGAAGASAGIDVASSLGLDPAIVARARELVGSDAVEAEGLMAKLRTLTAEASERAEALARSRATLEAEREGLAERAVADVARRRDEAKSALDAALREFREASRREIEGIRDARERAKAGRASVRAETRLRAATRDKAALAKGGPPETPPGGPFEPAAGDNVRIVSLDRVGVVAAVRKDRIEVRMGAATFAVRRSDIAPAASAGPVPARAPSRGTGRLAALAAASAGAAGVDEARPTVPVELHLIGRTVDEALPEIDRFLDASARDGRVEVRIIHGHGTGRLRAAVRRFAQSHPLVDSLRPGEPREGGDGATVVRLR